MAHAGVGAGLRARRAAPDRRRDRSSARACRSSPTTSTSRPIALDVAKKIAAAVRHSSGGLRFVKAMGVLLDDRGIVQVSMNLTNFEKTPIFRVFEFVKREAARYGVDRARERDRRPGAAGGAGRRRRVLPAARGLQRAIRCSRTRCASGTEDVSLRRVSSSASLCAAARSRTHASSDTDCCARRRARRRSATCCPAAAPARAGCSRARTGRAPRAAAAAARRSAGAVSAVADWIACPGTPDRRP